MPPVGYTGKAPALELCPLSQLFTLKYNFEACEQAIHQSNNEMIKVKVERNTGTFRPLLKNLGIEIINVEF